MKTNLRLVSVIGNEVVGSTSHSYENQNLALRISISSSVFLPSLKKKHKNVCTTFYSFTLFLDIKDKKVTGISPDAYAIKPRNNPKQDVKRGCGSLMKATIEYQ